MTALATDQDRRVATLYLARSGLMEPLGQSQIMAYLRGLSSDYRVSLITCEKSEDLDNEELLQTMRRECEQLGIHWYPQRFRFTPRLVAPALDMFRFAWLGWRAVRNGSRLVHARSYIPAAVALLLNRISGVPFIFDMRALWPEELIAAGRLQRGTWTHRAITWVERRCLSRGVVVSLTEAAANHLRARYGNELAGKPVHVIPTCADTERFVPQAFGQSPIVFGCNGSVLSGWFRLDWLAAFYRQAAERYPAARFEVVTRDDATVVRAAFEQLGVSPERVAVFSASPAHMPAVVQQQVVSVMFFTGGLSKLGSSPTRLAEVLSCGRPVVINAGIGDVDQIIEQYRVGVLIENDSDSAMRNALDELDVLLTDPDLSGRCRRVAEDLFSLATGTNAYRAIYESL